MAQPTMDDVATKAGVSRALVSLVMNRSPRVSDHSREKVLAVANEIGYRPNMAARNLASGQTQTIGLMLNDLHNPYFTLMAEGAAAAAEEAEMRVLISSGWKQDSGESQAIELLLGLRTDAVLLGSPRLPELLLEQCAAQTPTVVVGVWATSPAFDTINNDEDHGAELIVDHLMGLGHSRIAHIEGNRVAGGLERRDSFSKSMMNRGLAPILVEGDFDEISGYEGAKTVMALKEPPTAIFAGNDLSASGVLAYLDEAGLSAPGDVSVVGYDDTVLAGVGAVSLTTVFQPCKQIGGTAIQALLERIDGRTEARHEVLEPRLIVRSSTGPAPS